MPHTKHRDEFDDFMVLFRSLPDVFGALCNIIHRLKPELGEQVGEQISNFYQMLLRESCREEITYKLTLITTHYNRDGPLCTIAKHLEESGGICKYQKRVALQVMDNPSIVKEMLDSDINWNLKFAIDKTFIKVWPFVLDEILRSVYKLKVNSAPIMQIKDLWMTTRVDLQLLWLYAGHTARFSLQQMAPTLCFYRSLCYKIRKYLEKAEHDKSASRIRYSGDSLQIRANDDADTADFETHSKYDVAQPSVHGQPSKSQGTSKIGSGLEPVAATPHQSGPKRLHTKYHENEEEHSRAEVHYNTAEYIGKPEELTTYVTELEQDRDRLNKSNSKLLREIDASEDEIRQLKNANRSLMHNYKEQEKRLHDTLQINENLIQESEKAKEEKKTIENEYAQALADNDKRVKVLKAEIEESLTNYSQLTDNNSAISKKSEKSEKELKKLRTDYQNLLHSAKTRIQHLTEDNETLEQQNKAYKKSLKDSKPSASDAGDRDPHTCTAHIQHLTDDIRRLEEETTRLKRQVEDANEQYKLLKLDHGKHVELLVTANKHCESLQQENETLKRTPPISGGRGVRRDRPQTTQGRGSHSDAEVADLLAQFETQMQRLRDENTYLRASKDQILTNMSAQMNAEMSRDESDLENISVKNRPMKIQEEYALFCSQEWLDAKTALDDWAERNSPHIDEHKRCRVLVKAMLKCYNEMEESYQKTKDDIFTTIDGTFSKSDGGSSSTQFPSERQPNAAPKQLDRDIEVALAKSLKTTCDNIDFSSFAQEISVDLFTSGSTVQLAQTTEILQFLTKCLSICWKMVLQQPPMSLYCDDIGKKFIDKKHEPHFGSANPANRDAFIWYYVHPILMHGTKQMSKGKVILAIPRKT